MYAVVAHLAAAELPCERVEEGAVCEGRGVAVEGDGRLVRIVLDHVHPDSVVNVAHTAATPTDTSGVPIPIPIPDRVHACLLLIAIAIAAAATAALGVQVLPQRARDGDCPAAAPAVCVDAGRAARAPAQQHEHEALVLPDQIAGVALSTVAACPEVHIRPQILTVRSQAAADSTLQQTLHTLHSSVRRTVAAAAAIIIVVVVIGATVISSTGRHCCRTGCSTGGTAELGRDVANQPSQGPRMLSGNNRGG